MRLCKMLFVSMCVVCVSLSMACSPSDRLGVAAECAKNEDCQEQNQSCLTQFKGGYCGIADCKSNTDCPADASCVTHSDGKNYCFRNCLDKPECNANRSAANEANCSANVTFADGKKGGKKVCVPPSGA